LIIGQNLYANGVFFRGSTPLPPLGLNEMAHSCPALFEKKKRIYMHDDAKTGMKAYASLSVNNCDRCSALLYFQNLHWSAVTLINPFFPGILLWV